MPPPVGRSLMVIALALVAATFGVWAYRTFADKPPGEPDRDIRIENKTVAGINFEVELEQKQGVNLLTTGGPDSIRFTRGDDILEFDSGLLLVNDIGMPDVKAGDTVRWNLDGPLLINGQPVQPHPLQPHEIEATPITFAWTPLESPYPRDTLSVAWVGTTRLLVAAHGDGAIRVWDADKREVQKTIVVPPPKERKTKYGLRAAVSPDGKTIAAAYVGEEEVTLWDLATAEKKASFTEPKGGVNGLEFYDNMLLIEARGGVAYRRSLGNTASFRAGEKVHTEFISPLSAGATNDGSKIRFGLMSDPKAKAVVNEQGYRAISPVMPSAVMCFSPGQLLLAVFDGDSKLMLYSTVTGELQKRLRYRGRLGSTNSINALAFSPNGRTLAVGDNESIRLYDVTTGRERGGMATGWVRSLAYSADGRTLAAGLRYQPGLRAWNTSELFAKPTKNAE